MTKNSLLLISCLKHNIVSRFLRCFFIHHLSVKMLRGNLFSNTLCLFMMISCNIFHSPSGNGAIHIQVQLSAVTAKRIMIIDSKSPEVGGHGSWCVLCRKHKMFLTTLYLDSLTLPPGMILLLNHSHCKTCTKQNLLLATNR